MSDDYEVGYRRPPRHSQFKKGKSGNPKGRMRGRRGYATDLKEELKQHIVVKEGENQKSISKQRALFKGLLNKAIQGSPKHTAIVLRLMSDLFLADDAPEYPATPVEVEDAMEFFERLAREGNFIIEEDDHE